MVVGFTIRRICYMADIRMTSQKKQGNGSASQVRCIMSVLSLAKKLIWLASEYIICRRHMDGYVEQYVLEHYPKDIRKRIKNIIRKSRTMEDRFIGLKKEWIPRLEELKKKPSQ